MKKTLHEQKSNKKAISRSKEKHTIGRIEKSIEDDPYWHRAWEIIADKKIIKPKFNLEIKDGIYTTMKEETNKYFIRKYFPKDELGSDAQKAITEEIHEYNEE